MLLAQLELSLRRANVVSLYGDVPEIKQCKALLERSQWRSNDIRLYCNVPGRDQVL